MSEGENVTSLTIDEITAVGFVDQGANQDADVVIWKRADTHTVGDAMTDQTTVDVTEQRDDAPQVEGVFSRVMKAVGQALGLSEDDVTKALEDETMPEENSPEPVVDATDAPEPVAQTQEDETMAKADNAEPQVEQEQDVGDVLKSMPAEVRKLFAQQEDRIAKLAADAEEAREIAKREADRRETAEFTKRAEREFQSLGKSDEVGPLLKRCADQLDADTWSELEGVLKRAQGLADTGDVFKSFGTDREGTDRSPWSQILALAAARVEKGASKSQAEAVADVLGTPEGAQLYELHRRAN